MMGGEGVEIIGERRDSKERGKKPVLEKDVEHQPNEVDHGVLGAHCIAAAAAAARPIWRALSLEGGIAFGGV